MATYRRWHKTVIPKEGRAEEVGMEFFTNGSERPFHPIPLLPQIKRVTYTKITDLFFYWWGGEEGTLFLGGGGVGSRDFLHLFHHGRGWNPDASSESSSNFADFFYFIKEKKPHLAGDFNGRSVRLVWERTSNMVSFLLLPLLPTRRHHHHHHQHGTIILCSRVA